MNDREFPLLSSQAGGKNAAGGKNTIVHAIDTMESFSMLSIAPPANKVGPIDSVQFISVLITASVWRRHEIDHSVATGATPLGAKLV